MQEGFALFSVQAYVPVSESFGFAEDLRRKTAGAASALLVLSHWEELSEDPFFVPKTEEEIEEFGDGSSVLPNTARKLIDAVRRRKGLPVEEKVVQFATKQRTRARKV
jgi:ribosome assembly protein 1